MIGILKKKFSVLFVLLVLLSNTFFAPLQSFASSETKDLSESELKIGKIVTDQEDGVPLYKNAEQIDANETENEIAETDEDIDSSNILVYLNNNEIVKIIEEFETYSFVEFISNVDNAEDVFLSDDHNKDDLEIEQGYIDNKYLEIDSKVTETNSDQIESDPLEDTDKQTDQDESSTNVDVNEDDSADSLEDEIADMEDSEQENVSEEEVNDNSSQTTENDEEEEQPKEEQVDKTEEKTSRSSLQTYNISSFDQQGVAGKENTYIRKEATTKSDPLTIVPAGTVLKIAPYNENWYAVSTGGYIHKKHFELAVKKQESIHGVALKSPTNIRENASTKSKVVKTFPIGSIIDYKTFSEHWYQVTFDGNKVGYVHKKHVDNALPKQESLRGVTLKSPTNIRTTPSTKSNVLTTFQQGTIIDYKTFNEYWYEVTVDINGTKKTGFVHQYHVENATVKQESLRGVALKSPTNIRTLPSTQSNVLATYSIGSVIKYKTFNDYWYEVEMIIGGKRVSGFVHKKHVENATAKEETLRGVAQKSPTNIRTTPSTKSDVLTTYQIGSVINYKTFNDYWYEVSVRVGGVQKTGFVHKNHVENAKKQESIKLYTLKSPTNVRSRASTQADVIGTFRAGQEITLKTFSTFWYEVTINGKTGYIHKNHVGDPKDIRTNYNITLDEALAIQMKATPQTDKKYAWVSKTYINNNKVIAESGLNVRIGPGSNFKSLGTLLNGTTVNILDEYNGWYAIDYNHTTQWVHASPKDVLYYLNPNNFVNHEKQIFQFLDLSKPSGATAAVLNKALKGKGILEGQGQAFIDAGKQNDINDVYLISHAFLETGHGTSELATGVEVGKDKNGKTTMVTASNRKNLTNIKIVYNMFGIGAYDDCALKCGSERAYDRDWTTPYKAIVGGAEFIGNDYIKGQNTTNTVQNTIYKMRWNPEYMERTKSFGHQYATDVGWASKQINNMYNLYQQLDSYTLILDVPEYK
ncbi:SH3 domain-containing protein [Pseudogracilibacillus sp. SE30717A]|uniref:SH3 domain-containing protein n=1 Tax=Pseudogracilibacillus sp. SE30717A TaxID=3098293 RepID=UPI00300DD697